MTTELNQLLTDAFNSKFMLSTEAQKDKAKEDLSQLIAEQIHTAIMAKKFYHWYNNGKWDLYISGHPDASSYDEIIRDIKDLFKLK